MEYQEIENFLLNNKDIPIIDVRSPSEYQKGHIPEAINIPLFSDTERSEVGTIYKKKGRIKAIEKGLEFAGPRLKELAMQARKATSNNHLRVYCWRGGMRSEKMAWLFETAGLSCYVLKGGFKSYRNRLLSDFNDISKLIVLQGATGAGKTAILQKMLEKGEQVLDLEKHANHRGSAFGDIGLGDQPSNLQFQNNLHASLLKLDCNQRIWVESESLTIGKVFLPETLWEKMNDTPVIELVMPKELRVRRLVEEYGKFDKESLIRATEKIRKRFGGNRVNEVIEYIEADDLFNAASLLLDYYDKSYTFGQQKYKNRDSVKIESKTGDPEVNAELLIEYADKLNLFE